MKSKIISIFLAILILCQTSLAFAWDMPSLEELIDIHVTGTVDLDRIHKYDYIELSSEEEEADGKEHLEYSNAVNVVRILELMANNDEGLFVEADFVPKKDFAKIISVLTMGNNPDIEKKYDSLPQNEYITFGEAAQYFVRLVGYEVYEQKYRGDNPSLTLAEEIGILDGISYTSGKPVTRGELAEMLYNTLRTDVLSQTAFGENERYEAVEGETYLKQRFGYEFVNGTVTSQFGFNVYPDTLTQSDVISIERVNYNLGECEIEDVLGRKVEAIVRFGSKKLHDIIGIYVDENDDSLVCDIDKNTYISDGMLYYMENGKEARKRISDIERVILNDREVASGEFENALNNAEGELRLGMLDESSRYNLAIIRDWATYSVAGVSAVDERINLKHGVKYNGNTYLDLSGKEHIYFVNAGEYVTFDDIAPGSVIDVLDSPTAMYIAVSNNIVTGTITEIDSDYVYIDGAPYAVSRSYDSARLTDNKLSELKVGSGGSFYINSFGRIADFSESTDVYNIGVLAEFGKQGSGMSAKAALRIFTDSNKWENFGFAETITLDGTKKVPELEAIDILEQSRSNVSYQPIRYRHNGKGDIVFLDTAIEDSAENDDAKSIKFKEKISIKMNWTIANDAHPGGLGDLNYFVNPTGYFIRIPRDVDNEEEYFIRRKQPYSSSANYTLYLYNVDEYGVADIIVDKCEQGANAMSSSISFLVITRISKVLNSDGEETLAITGFDSTPNSGYIMSTYTITSKEVAQRAASLKIGDIIHFVPYNKELSDFEMFTTVDDVMTVDKLKCTCNDENYMKGLGTVTAVDAERGGLVKLDIVTNKGEESEKTTEKIWVKQHVSIYERATNEAYNATMGDIHIGDRIFGCGGHNYMRLLVIR